MMNIYLFFSFFLSFTSFEFAIDPLTLQNLMEIDGVNLVQKNPFSLSKFKSLDLAFWFE